jgi:dihydrofolate reductase
MRKIILFTSISLDGYIEGPNGELDWQTVDEELHGHFNDVLKTMSAFLCGRVMHEMMAGFWPTADADPSAPAVMAEYAGIWRDMPKIVFSRTLDHADWNATIMRDVDVDAITALKRQPGGDMSLGGADLAATFMKLGLVDEYRIYIHPVLVGQGKPLFPSPGALVGLELAETRTFGSGVVLLHYRRPDPMGR